MKLIIAGSRNLSPTVVQLDAALKTFDLKPETIISGTARGVDRAGEKWAKERGVKILYYPANWDEYGKRAGFLRNEEMAKAADALLLWWDGQSSGSASMKGIMERAGKLVCEVVVP